MTGAAGAMLDATGAVFLRDAEPGRAAARRRPIRVSRLAERVLPSPVLPVVGVHVNEAIWGLPGAVVLVEADLRVRRGVLGLMTDRSPATFGCAGHIARRAAIGRRTLRQQTGIRLRRLAPSRADRRTKGPRRSRPDA